MIRPATAPPLGRSFVVNRNSPQAVGLVGWWPTLSWSRSGVLPERTRRTLAATMTGPGWTARSSVAAGVCLDLSTSDYVSIGPNKIGPILNGAPAITFSAWVEYDTLRTVDKYDNVFVVFWLGAAACLWINVTGDGGRKILVGGRSRNTDGFKEVVGSTTINASTLVHVCGILNFSAGTITCYLNGALDGINAAAGFGGTSYAHLAGLLSDSFSHPSLGNRAWDGLIADIRIYNRALSAAEVWQMWAPQSRWQLYGVRAPRGRAASIYAAMMRHHHAMLAGGRS